MIALHVDQSVKDAKDGLNYTAFRGQPQERFLPARGAHPQATTALQTEVDRLYDIFVNRRLPQMRGIGSDAVRATEAGLFFGEQAVAAGLADAVMPFDAVMTEFTDALAAKQRPAQPNVAGLAAKPVPSNHFKPARSKPLTLETP